MESVAGLRVLYDIHGTDPNEHVSVYDEQILSHWEGYGGRGPVRIGNIAAHQVQLDIYGDLMDSVYLCDKYIEPMPWDFWISVREAIVEPVMRGWRESDHGIWEIREETKQYVHSKVMAWVALDRAIHLAYKRSLPGDVAEWTRQRDMIKTEVMEKGWSIEQGAFVQSYGSSQLDASILIMPLVFFISPTDARMKSTIQAVLM